MNEHALPSCPLMKSWIIKRKPRPDNNVDSDNHSCSVSGVNSVLASSPTEDTNLDNSHENIVLSSIAEEPID